MMKRLLPSLLLLLVSAPFVRGQAEPEKKPPQQRYETRREHDPHGTGKFYKDREIAQVMGYQGANWLERPEREKEENTSKLLPGLELKPGSVVADIGAGSGYYTERLSKLVGAKGKVFAVDIQPEMIELIRRRMKSRGLKNVQLVQNTVLDLKLPAESVDLILLVDVYHEFSHPYEMTAAMVKALKPGGRIAFVEYRGEDPKVPILEVHKMTEKQVVKEMEGFPLRHVRTLGHLPWQHVILFEKRAADAAPASTPAPKEPGSGKDPPR